MRFFFWAAPALAAFSLDFSVRRGNAYPVSSIDSEQLVERDSLEVTIQNERVFYVVELEIGSQKSKVEVLVDTGSSDLWVPASNCSSNKSSKREVVDRKRVLDEQSLNHLSRLEHFAEEAETLSFIAKQIATGVNRAAGSSSTVSSSRASTLTPTSSVISATRSLAVQGSEVSACTAYGTYDSGRSSSVKLNHTLGDFSIDYGDGSFAKGKYVSDDVVIGGQTVKGLNFAVCDQTDSEIGVLGLGFPALEASYLLGDVDQRYSHQYQNLPMLLKSEGIIERNVYSVSLGKGNASEGVVLFGAVDHSKYTDTLQRVKVLNRYRNIGEKAPVYLEIALDSIRGDNITVNYRTSVVLDTGATNNFLPSAYLTQIGTYLGGKSGISGIWTVPCTHLSSDESLIFSFSGVEISVPVKDLILQTSGGSCYLGIFKEETKPNLGDSFLRNAYVVYDLDEYEIALAPASNGTGEADIEEVTGTIPNAQTAQLFEFTSISQQFGFTSVGTRSRFTVFTATFDNIVPSAASTTGGSSTVRSMRVSTSSSATATQGSSESSSARLTPMNSTSFTSVTISLTSMTNLGAANSISTTTSQSASSRLASSSSTGEGSSPSQGLFYLLLGIFTALSLLW